MDPQTVSKQPQIQHSFENPLTLERRINWLKVFLIVLGAFGLIGAGVYLGARMIKSNQTKFEDSMTAKPSPTEYMMPTAIAEPTREAAAVISPTSAVLDETVEWKLYEGKFGNYTFKYPSNWSLAEQSEGCGPVFTPPKEIIDGWLTICGPYLGLNDTPEQLSNQAVGADKLLSRDNITLDAHVGIKQEVEGYQTRLEVYISDVKIPQPESTPVNYPKKGTLNSIFYIMNSNNINEAKKIFDQILSTFKFNE